MASAAQEFAELQRLPPAEAIAYLQRRSPLTKTFAWQELWEDEHAQQFTVSRLARLDLLHDIRDLITRSVEGDLSRRDFMKSSEELLAKAGWWGKKAVVDPISKREVVTTFDPARLKLIYDTNTRMAYAAGQWERIERNQKTHPFMRYITKRDERVRASHRAWNGVTLPVDDPFWLTHLPPNGWRCRCRVVAVSQREYDLGTTSTGVPMIKVAPEVPMREWLDKRTGEIKLVPIGIDPGFGYNVGVASARAASLQQVVAERLAKAAPDLARTARDKGMAQWHTPANVTDAVDFVKRSAARPQDKQPLQVLGTVSSMATQRAQTLGVDLTGRTVALEHDGVLHTLKSHGKPSEALRGQIPVAAEDLARFRDLFNRAQLALGDPPIAKDGSKVLEGEVILGGIVYHLAARVRRKHIVPFTMFKRPVRK
jgi:SPP1 gp7 family putative phage head morphogenesis protein